MAAKNVKTRNLSTEIQNNINTAMSDQYRIVSGFEDGLKHKEVSLEYVKKQSGHDDFTAKLARQTRRAESNVKDHRRKYDEILADRLNMKGDNATEALLAETRATKTWARIERDLAGKSKTDQLQIIENHISAAVKRGDHITVAAINSEAPHFLTSNGVKEPEHLIELIVRTYDPELSQAHATIQEAEKLVAVVRHNTEMAQRAFENNLNAGIKDRVDDIERVPYYIDPAEAVRNSITEANEELKAALELQQQVASGDDDTDDGEQQHTENFDSTENDGDTTPDEPDTDEAHASRFNDPSIMAIGPNESITD